MNTLLYNQDQDQDRINLLAFIDSFAEQMGLEYALIDIRQIREITSYYNVDFPHDGGIEKASPFKKIAYFMCWFIHMRPISEAISEDIIGKELHKIPNHQNAICALTLGINALHQSTVIKTNDDGEKETYLIKNKIELSRHSFIDIVEAISSISNYNWKLMSVLLEQLVYKANPDCQYPVQ